MGRSHHYAGMGMADAPVRKPSVGESIESDDLPRAWLQRSLYETTKLLERLLSGAGVREVELGDLSALPVRQIGHSQMQRCPFQRVRVSVVSKISGHAEAVHTSLQRACRCL